MREKNFHPSIAVSLCGTQSINSGGEVFDLSQFFANFYKNLSEIFSADLSYRSMTDLLGYQEGAPIWIGIALQVEQKYRRAVRAR